MSIREQIQAYLLSERKCDCDLCQRGRKFMSIVNKLPDETDVQWMSDFYDYVIEHEESTDMEIQYLENKLEKQSNTE